MVNRSLFLILLVILSLNCTAALSWLDILKRKEHDLGQKLDVLGLSGNFLDELDDLPDLSQNLGASYLLRKKSTNIEALKANSFKPDCFKQAANKITARCQDLELDEEARVDAAILMTMCEVATGQQYSLPSECMSYSTGQHTTVISVRTRGKCVDALARSPQFWSSYSGYLREIPQLCHVYRRWNDIDLARNIYYNVTIEKVNFLNLLFDHEKKTEHHLQDLVLQSEILRDTVREMKIYAQLHESSAEHFIMEIEKGLRHVLELFNTQASKDLNNREKAVATSIEKFEGSLEGVLVRNSARLSEFATSLTKVVRSHVDELVVSHKSYYEQFFRDLVTTRNTFTDLHQDFYSLKQEVDLLLVQTVNISDVVTTSLRGASSLQTVQAETSKSADQLIRTLEDLTETTYAELGKINVSAFEIQRLLVPQDPVVPWGRVALQIFSIVGQGYDLSAVQHLASFQFFFSAISCLWAIFRVFISSVMASQFDVSRATRFRYFRYRAQLCHVYCCRVASQCFYGKGHPLGRFILRRNLRFTAAQLPCVLVGIQMGARSTYLGYLGGSVNLSDGFVL